MKALRAITLMLAMILCTTAAMAQSAADKLYNQGLQAQKTMTIASQNNAIAKFKKAKAMYDSASKKAQCDQAISVSNNIIAQLKGGGGGGGRNSGGGGNTQTVEEKKEDPTLTLSNTSFEFPMDFKKQTITVNTNQDDWSIYPIASSTGAPDFVLVEKTGTNTAELTIRANTTHMTRTQEVGVTAGPLTEKITITQTGRPVFLSVNESAIKFKWKGGDKKLEIVSNSEEEYSQNNGLNWYIAEKPDWVEVSVNQGGGGGMFGGLINKGRDAVNGLLNGKSADNSDSAMVKTSIKIICDQYSGSSTRKGSLTIVSGNSSTTLVITQDPK